MASGSFPTIQNNQKQKGHGYEAFQALKAKYEADITSPGILNIGWAIKITPEARLDIARLIQEFESIKLGFDSIVKPVSRSHQAYTLYQALQVECASFKILHSRQAADIGNLEFDEISAWVAAFLFVNRKLQKAYMNFKGPKLFVKTSAFWSGIGDVLTGKENSLNSLLKTIALRKGEKSAGKAQNTRSWTEFLTADYGWWPIMEA